MDKSNVTSIDYETVFNATLFDVEKASLTLTSGKKLTHFVVRRHPTVSVIPVTDAQEIYMVSEYRYMHKKTLLELASGFIDKGETALQAAQRELEEELGIKARQWEQLIHVDQNASVIDAQYKIFLAKGLELGKPRPTEDEAIRVVKVPLDEALNLVLTGQITTSESIIGILLVDRLRRDKKL